MAESEFPPLPPVIVPDCRPVSKFVPLVQQEGTTNFLDVSIAAKSIKSVIPSSQPQHYNRSDGLPNLSCQWLCCLKVKEEFVVNFKLIEPLTDKQCLLVRFELECTNPEKRHVLDKWSKANSNEPPIELINNSVLAQTVTYSADTRKFEFPWIYSMGDKQYLSFRLNYDTQKSSCPLRFRVTTELFSKLTLSYSAAGALLCPVYVYHEKNRNAFQIAQHGNVLDPYNYANKHVLTELLQQSAGSDVPNREQQSLEQANSVDAQAVFRSTNSLIKQRSIPWTGVVPNDCVCINSLAKHFFGTNEFAEIFCNPGKECVMTNDGWSLAKKKIRDGMWRLTLDKYNIKASESTANTAEASTDGSHPQEPAKSRPEASSSTMAQLNNSQAFGQPNGVKQSILSTLLQQDAQRSAETKKPNQPATVSVASVIARKFSPSPYEVAQSYLQGQIATLNSPGVQYYLSKHGRTKDRVASSRTQKGTTKTTQINTLGQLVARTPLQPTSRQTQTVKQAPRLVNAVQMPVLNTRPNLASVTQMKSFKQQSILASLLSPAQPPPHNPPIDTTLQLAQPRGPVTSSQLTTTRQSMPPQSNEAINLAFHHPRISNNRSLALPQSFSSPFNVELERSSNGPVASDHPNLQQTSRLTTTIELASPEASVTQVTVPNVQRNQKSSPTFATFQQPRKFTSNQSRVEQQQQSQSIDTTPHLAPPREPMVSAHQISRGTLTSKPSEQPEKAQPTSKILVQSAVNVFSECSQPKSNFALSSIQELQSFISQICSPIPSRTNTSKQIVPGKQPTHLAQPGEPVTSAHQTTTLQSIPPPPNDATNLAIHQPPISNKLSLSSSQACLNPLNVELAQSSNGPVASEPSPQKCVSSLEINIAPTGQYTGAQQAVGQPAPQKAQTVERVSLASSVQVRMPNIQPNQARSKTYFPSQKSNLHNTAPSYFLIIQPTTPVNAQTSQKAIHQPNSAHFEPQQQNRSSSHPLSCSSVQTAIHVPMAMALFTTKEQSIQPAYTCSPIAAIHQLAQPSAPVTSVLQNQESTRHQMPQPPKVLAIHSARIAPSNVRSLPAKQKVSGRFFAANPQSSYGPVSSANANPPSTPASVYLHQMPTSVSVHQLPNKKHNPVFQPARITQSSARSNQMPTSVPVQQLPNNTLNLASQPARVTQSSARSNQMPTSVSVQQLPNNTLNLASHAAQISQSSARLNPMPTHVSVQPPQSNNPTNMPRAPVGVSNHNLNLNSQHQMPSRQYTPQEFDPQCQEQLRIEQLWANPATHPYGYDYNQTFPLSLLSNDNQRNSIFEAQESNEQLSIALAPVISNESFIRQPNTVPRSIQPQQQKTSIPRRTQNRISRRQYYCQEHNSNFLTNQFGNKQSLGHLHGHCTNAQSNRAQFIQCSGCTEMQRYQLATSNQQGLYQFSQGNRSNTINQNMLNSEPRNTSLLQIYSTLNTTPFPWSTANPNSVGSIALQSQMQVPACEYSNVRTSCHKASGALNQSTTSYSHQTVNSTYSLTSGQMHQQQSINVSGNQLKQCNTSNDVSKGTSNPVYSIHSPCSDDVFFATRQYTLFPMIASQAPKKQNSSRTTVHSQLTPEQLENVDSVQLTQFDQKGRQLANQAGIDLLTSAIESIDSHKCPTSVKTSSIRQPGNSVNYGGQIVRDKNKAHCIRPKRSSSAPPIEKAKLSYTTSTQSSNQHLKSNLILALPHLCAQATTLQSKPPSPNYSTNFEIHQPRVSNNRSLAQQQSFSNQFNVELARSSNGSIASDPNLQPTTKLTTTIEHASPEVIIPQVTVPDAQPNQKPSPALATFQQTGIFTSNQTRAQPQQQNQPIDSTSHLAQPGEPMVSAHQISRGTLTSKPSGQPEKTQPTSQPLVQSAFNVFSECSQPKSNLASSSFQETQTHHPQICSPIPSRTNTSKQIVSGTQPTQSLQTIVMPKTQNRVPMVRVAKVLVDNVQLTSSSSTPLPTCQPPTISTSVNLSDGSHSTSSNQANRSQLSHPTNAPPCVQPGQGNATSSTSTTAPMQSQSNTNQPVVPIKQEPMDSEQMQSPPKYYIPMKLKKIIEYMTRMLRTPAVNIYMMDGHDLRDISPENLMEYMSRKCTLSTIEAIVERFDELFQDGKISGKIWLRDNAIWQKTCEAKKLSRSGVTSSQSGQAPIQVVVTSAQPRHTSTGAPMQWSTATEVPIPVTQSTVRATPQSVMTMTKQQQQHANSCSNSISSGHLKSSRVQSNALLANSSTQARLLTLQSNSIALTRPPVTTTQPVLPISPTSSPLGDLSQVTGQSTTNNQPTGSHRSKRTRTVVNYKEADTDEDSDRDTEFVQESRHPIMTPQTASIASGSSSRVTQNRMQTPRKQKKVVPRRVNKHILKGNPQIRIRFFRKVCICQSMEYIDNRRLIACLNCGLLHHRKCIKMPIKKVKDYSKKPKWVFMCFKCNTYSPDHSQCYLGPNKCLQLYNCICNAPFDHNRSYVECDRCRMKFHQSCFGLVDKHAKLLPEFFCLECSQLNFDHGRLMPQPDDKEGRDRFKELQNRFGKEYLAEILQKYDEISLEQIKIMTRIPTQEDFELFESAINRLKANAHSKLFHNKIPGDTYLHFYNMTTSKNLHFGSIMKKIRERKYKRVGEFVFAVNELLHSVRRYTRRIIKTYEEDEYGRELSDTWPEIEQFQDLEMYQLNLLQQRVQEKLERERKPTVETTPKYVTMDHLSTAHIVFISCSVTELQNDFAYYMDTELGLEVNWPVEFNEDQWSGDETDDEQYFVERIPKFPDAQIRANNSSSRKRGSASAFQWDESSSDGEETDTTQEGYRNKRARQSHHQQSRKLPREISENEKRIRMRKRRRDPNQPGTSHD